MFARLTADFPRVSDRFAPAVSISFIAFVLRFARTGAFQQKQQAEEEKEMQANESAQVIEILMYSAKNSLFVSLSISID